MLTTNDPIADMLTRIRNANTAKHDTVEIPASKMKLAIAGILQEEGYIRGYELVDAKGDFKNIRVELKYNDNKKEKVITGLKRISKPGLRIYAGKEELTRTLPAVLTITEKDGQLTVERPNDEKETRALHGLTRSLLNNMVVGVTDGYSKSLEINGVGYRAQKQGKTLTLSLGYSHPVVMEDPEGISTEVKDNQIIVSGISKEAVGQYAAVIREKRPPEPYKGKGIKYADEVIRRKVGKTGKK